ncbi:MAG: hypothetical protein HG456_000290 [candidate division SR1 bacterium]|nr:hypothetical protein [candidate division SR1 bacterium]
MFKTFREKAGLVVLIVWLLSMLARVETLSRANADPFYFLMSASIFIEVIWYKKYHLFRLNFWGWLLILIYTVFWIFFFLYLLLMVAFDIREIRIIQILIFFYLQTLSNRTIKKWIFKWCSKK